MSKPNIVQQVENLANPIATGSTVPRKLQDRFADIINVCDFGAKGDGVTEDTNAIQAAYNYAVSKGGGTIFFPDGKYVVTRWFDIYRRASSTNPIRIFFKGLSSDQSRIIVKFEDVNHAVFTSIPSTELIAQLGYKPRSAPVSFEGLGFVLDSTVDPEKAPGAIWVYGHGNSYFHDIFTSSSQNTHIRSLSAQNVRVYNLASWYGGKTFLYKDTSGISFTTTNTGTNIGKVTANSDIFETKDIGKILTLRPEASGGASSQVTITSVIDARNVNVSGPVQTFTSNVKCLFETARATMAAGSRVLTANTSCFKASDVGRIIFIRNAKRGDHGPALLRGVIVQVTAPNQVVLSEAADNSIGYEFFGQPAVEFFNPYDATDSSSSDVKFYQLHIEHYRGIGMVNGRCDAYELIGGKIHGTTWETSETTSTAGLWLDDADGSYKLTFDTGTSTTDAIIYACNLNSCVTFSDVYARMIQNQKLIHTESMYSQSGCVVINGFKSYNKFYTPDQLIIDQNTSTRTKMFGIVQCASAPQIYPYVGNALHIDNQNNIYQDGNINITNGDINVENDNMCGIRISQRGSRAWKAMVSGSNFYIQDATSDTLKLGISSSSGAVFPPVNNSQSLGNGSFRWAEVFAVTGAINTSDEREKDHIINIDEALMRAWGKVGFKIFQFRDAIQKKGADARIHVGVIAQEVRDAFASEGLDATRYGLLCHDQWDDQYETVEVIDVEEVKDEYGNIVEPAVKHYEERLIIPAGDRYGIRYEEALALECAYQRWRLNQIEARLS